MKSCKSRTKNRRLCNLTSDHATLSSKILCSFYFHPTTCSYILRIYWFKWDITVTFHYMAESCWDLIIRLSVRNQRRRFFVRFSSAHVRSDMIRHTILIRSCYPIFRPGLVLDLSSSNLLLWIKSSGLKFWLSYSMVKIHKDSPHSLD